MTKEQKFGGNRSVNPAGDDHDDHHDHDDHDDCDDCDAHDDCDDYDIKITAAWSVRREARFRSSWSDTGGRHPVSRSS